MQMWFLLHYLFRCFDGHLHRNFIEFVTCYTLFSYLKCCIIVVYRTTSLFSDLELLRSTVNKSQHVTFCHVLMETSIYLMGY